MNDAMSWRGISVTVWRAQRGTPCIPNPVRAKLLAGSLTTACSTLPEVQWRALLARVATAAQVTQYPILATSYSI